MTTVHATTGAPRARRTLGCAPSGVVGDTYHICASSTYDSYSAVCFYALFIRCSVIEGIYSSNRAISCLI